MSYSRFVLLFFVSLCAGASARAQQPSSPAVPSAAAPVPVTNSSSESPVALPPHRFWDRENDWLFAGVTASRALDYTSTLNMRRRGRQEILLTNWIVDHHAAFAGIEAGSTALSVGVSYLFHRTGHHSLERWVSIAHIGLASAGDIRNYSLKTAHPAPSPSSSFVARPVR